MLIPGFSRGTANWATNVGNEHNQVLMSVITEGEGEGLRKMLNGIVCRYRDASIPPPKVLYTDRDCCGRQSVKKYFEAAWPFLQIRYIFYTLSMFICMFLNEGSCRKCWIGGQGTICKISPQFKKKVIENLILWVQTLFTLPRE